MEKAEWKSFKNITTNVPGIHMVDIYFVIVADLVKSQKPKECNKSLEGHFIDFHLDFFAENLWRVSCGNRERFDQDIA